MPSSKEVKRMTYYDHASMQNMKLGSWQMTRDEPSKLPTGHGNIKGRQSIRSGAWAGLFACFCWFM